METMIAWKIYKKSDGCHVDTVWYQPNVTAEDVHEYVERDFDFEILIALDEAD